MSDSRKLQQLLGMQESTGNQKKGMLVMFAEHLIFARSVLLDLSNYVCSSRVEIEDDRLNHLVIVS